MVTLDTIDKRLPEAADDPIAITDRRIKGLLKNNIALENISPGIFMAIEMKSSDELGVE